MLKKLSLPLGVLLVTMLIGEMAFASDIVTAFEGSLTLLGADVITLFKAVAAVVAIVVTGFLLMGVFKGSAH